MLEEFSNSTQKTTSVLRLEEKLMCVSFLLKGLSRVILIKTYFLPHLLY